MLYERSLNPTYAEDLIYQNNRIVSRMMTKPTSSEIANGKTLNAFLPYIMKLSESGVQGPPVPINPMALKRINVTSGPTGPKWASSETRRSFGPWRSAAPCNKNAIRCSVPPSPPPPRARFSPTNTTWFVRWSNRSTTISCGGFAPRK